MFKEHICKLEHYILSSGIALLSICLLNSCMQSTRSNSIQAKEIENLTWFIEDICHGIQRDSKELIQDHSSNSMLHLIAWLRSSEDEDLMWPLHIRKRIGAWKIIKTGIHDGTIAMHNNGQLFLQDSASSFEAQVYAQSIHEENRNRLTIDQLVLQHSGLEARSKRAQQLLTALHTARMNLDHEAQTKHEQP